MSEWLHGVLLLSGLKSRQPAALNIMWFYWSVHLQGPGGGQKRRKADKAQTNRKHLNNTKLILEVSIKL